MSDPVRKLRILVVEDSVDRQAVLRRLYGTHHLVVVDNVAEAKSQLAAAQFDLVSLDYDLGIGGRGDEVAQFLAGVECRPSGIIVHSMNPEGARAIRALLPNAIVLPASSLERGTPLYGRLRSILAVGGDIDWDFVLMGKVKEAE